MVAAWLVLMMRLRRLSPFRRKGCSRGSRRRGGALSKRSEGLAVGMGLPLWLGSTEGHDHGGAGSRGLLRQKLLLRAMAVHVGALGEAPQRRRLGFARAGAHRAARDEGTTVGLAGARRLTARFGKVRRVDTVEPAGPEFRYRGGEQVGIGMLRRLHDHAAGTALHHLAGIEDHHLIADGAYRCEIVADEHKRQAELPAQLR